MFLQYVTIGITVVLDTVHCLELFFRYSISETGSVSGIWCKEGKDQKQLSSVMEDRYLLHIWLSRNVSFITYNDGNKSWFQNIAFKKKSWQCAVSEIVIMWSDWRSHILSSLRRGPVQTTTLWYNCSIQWESVTVAEFVSASEFVVLHLMTRLG
jgi:hypothetical protein